MDRLRRAGSLVRTNPYESLKSTAFPGKGEKFDGWLTFADGADLWWTMDAYNARLRTKTDTFERETRQMGLVGGVE